MTMEDQQHHLDIISCESNKLSNFKKILAIEKQQVSIARKKNNACADASKTDRDQQDEADKIQFQMECTREAEERRSLLQAVVSECQASGFKMPPSLIKLLHYNNGNFK